jgi:flagellar biosynthesis protein FlhG
VVEHPDAKASKNIERIARKLLGTVDHERPGPAEEPRRTEEQSLYEVLEVDPGASDEDVRRAHKRMREMYSPDSMVVCGLFTPDRLAEVQRRLEEAYDTLLDTEKRRDYDRQLFPEGAARTASIHTPAHGIVAPVAREDTPPPQPIPEPAIDATTEFTGDLLRRVREARGIDLLEISQRTKIGIGHLRSIEDERWEAMPAQVYLRGFLVEYARFLHLDVPQVARTFLDRFHKARGEED